MLYFDILFRFFRDRFRTVVNVLGDSFGAAIVAHYSQKELATIPSSSEINGKPQRNSMAHSAETVLFEERL